MPDKELFTLLEISKMLGLSLTTIRRYSANGSLPTIHLSKRTVRVTRAMFDSIIKKGLSYSINREVNQW